MKKQIKLVVISHALAQKSAWARWQRLSEMFPVDVTLLVPLKWISFWFDKETVFENNCYTSNNFHVIPIKTSSESNWCTYYFKSIDAKLSILKPDIIFVVQEPLTYVLTQMMIYRLLWARKSKIVFYSYINIPFNAPSLKGKVYAKTMMKITKGFTHMAVCGSSEARIVLKEMGYRKPIVVQTEIGIDELIYYPDEKERNRIRLNLNVDGFIIGFCGRLCPEKGIMDLVEACFNLEGNWKLFCVGDGELRQEIIHKFSEADLDERLVITGQIPHNEVQKYLRAMDCLVLPSRTTATWKEQFGLVLPQAMACGVPVIGSNSGAIPEVIGECGFVFPEGDVGALSKCIKELMTNTKIHSTMVEKGLSVGAKKYSASHLARELYGWFLSILMADPLLASKIHN